MEDGVAVGFELLLGERFYVWCFIIGVLCLVFYYWGFIIGVQAGLRRLIRPLGLSRDIHEAFGAGVDAFLFNSCPMK